MERHILDEYIKQNGVYYSNQEIILKLIKPLFLDELYLQLEKIKFNGNELLRFHNKISNLSFLDPANGTGNFLIITYFELFKLELKIIKSLTDLKVPYNFKINAGQFYGIDIDNYACEKCKRRIKQLDDIINKLYEKILKQNVGEKRFFICPKIVNKNALQIDWNDVVSKTDLNYIMGNPPFVGARLMSKSQKNDLFEVWEGHKKTGDLDYVTAWYKKAADYMSGTKIESAFVSTNSISQGQQPAILWRPLMKENHTVINFAYKPFKWSNKNQNESKKFRGQGKQAAVHCIIIGFSDYKNSKEKKIFKFENNFKIVKNINPYLVEAPNILIERRSMPLCNVPTIGIGNKPIDGGYYIFTEKEKYEFIDKEPLSQKLFKRWMGAEELLNGYKRYYLYAKNCSPRELKKMPEVLKRIKLVSNYRLNSKSISTKKLANYPLEFHVTNIPNSDYLAIPKITSENKKYIPMEFINKKIIASDLLNIIPNANLYHFGILISSIHMTWVKATCGRLGNEYRYSGTVVYNNFIWPNTTKKQKENIEKAAQSVLDSRKLYPNSTLSDLYDPNTMPPELTKAHERLDKAVKVAYGSKGFETEEEIVGSLMKLYKKAVDREKLKNKKIS